MRILFLCPRRCWPVNSGANLRDYHLATGLARGAQVTYAAICLPEDAPGAGSSLPRPESVFERTIAWEDARPFTAVDLLRGWIGPSPVTVLKWTSRAAALKLAALGREMRFDTIHMVGVHLVKYVPVLREFPGRPAIVCDWPDSLSEQMERYAEIAANPLRRMYARRTTSLLRRAEAETLDACERHTAVSELNRRRLLELRPAARIDVIENGVDTAHFTPRNDGDRRRVVFVGAMDYFANAEAALRFAREDWPAVRKRCNGLVLTIVGRKPDAAVRALASEAAGIEVTGTVDDVRPYYHQARAAIVPLRAGSGTRLKILEAMAAGVPVVSTALGAEGLEVRSGENIMIADTTEQTAEAIARVAEPGVFRESMIGRGRELVEGRYDWGALAARLLQVHADLRGAR